MTAKWRRVQARVRIGLLAFGALALVGGLLIDQGRGVLIGIAVVALVVAIWLKPSPPPPPDEATITPWQKGSGPL